ncbi:DUF2470 domain-containing protein [Stackebrandtia soli]|uniref:DUF2470 domain-containing protein n=1 Tax=Stackebrandtia soli TaxID=1892856 RepID=UPI0039E8BA11
MRPDPAEIVRTLAAGHRPAVVHTVNMGDAVAVPSAVDVDGTPLLLTADLGPLGRALAEPTGLDAAVAVRFDDEPPLPCAPSLGSAWLSGWAEVVPVERRRDAAIAFSRSNPLPELLDVGAGFTLWRLEVAEARWENGESVVTVDDHAYATATADPWYPIEVELLLDLYDHHPEVLDALTERMRERLPQAERVTPLRINRHGITLDVHCGESARRYLVRHHGDVADLPRLLHGLTCCRCLRRAAIEG